MKVSHTDRLGVWVFAERADARLPSLIIVRPGLVEVGALKLAVGVMWAPRRRRAR